MSFLAWQLAIVVDFFVSSLVLPPPSVQAPSEALQTVASGLGRRACVVRALAQLLYENGDRLGTRFDSVLPALLALADLSAADLEARWVGGWVSGCGIHFFVGAVMRILQANPAIGKDTHLQPPPADGVVR